MNSEVSRTEHTMEGAIALLTAAVGHWNGVTRTWFEPGELADESPVRATLRPQINDQFFLLEYQGSLGGNPLAGSALIGYSQAGHQYEMAWIDTVHTGGGIMLLTDPARGAKFSVQGGYSDPDGGPQWGWRIEFELEQLDQLVIRHHNISPSGDEEKAIETVLHRAHPDGESETLV